MNRLNTDRSIGHLTVQFVPLKVATNGEPWKKWSSRYRHEGDGIPIIYIIRADGEKLYGQSGALPSDQLPRLMMTALESAGRVLNERQVADLTEIVKKSKQALADERHEDAVRELLRSAKIGSVGSIGSYAKVAIESDELVRQCTEQARQIVSASESDLETGDADFDSVLRLVEAKRVFGRLPTLKANFSSVSRKHARREAIKRQGLGSAFRPTAVKNPFLR